VAEDDAVYPRGSEAKEDAAATATATATATALVEKTSI
jgi:hypothetical protein